MTNTSEDFEKIIQGYSNEIKVLARQTRRLVHEILPTVVEVAWIKQKNIGFGTGPKKKTEHFCWLMPAKNHITLGFNYGAELSDPKQLLEGTGKLYRHWKIRSAADLENFYLKELIRVATTYRVTKKS
jgi:hypothetical protein